MANMDISSRGLVELIGHEGIVQTRYRDSVGIWTIGVGHTSAAGDPDPERFDGEMSLAEIFDLFRRDLRAYVQDVNRAVQVPVSETEFDALVSFHYNTGGIARASLVESLNAGNREKAAREFLNWRRPPEIIRRRNMEQRLFAEGIYSHDGTAAVYRADGHGRVQWSNGHRIALADFL